MAGGLSGKYIPVALVVLIAAAAGIGLWARYSGGPPTQAVGSLVANMTIGPIVPACSANSTVGPAGSPWSSIQVVITDSLGTKISSHVSWTSNGCYVSGSMTTTLSPGTYSLTLTSCCGTRGGLPKAFTITSNQITALNVSVDTGIR